MSNLHPYTRQRFRDTAVRRAKEARVLLSVPHKSCDGAVTCGLLAAECALKATLLHGHQASMPEELPPKIQKQMFEGSSGHSIFILWTGQASRIQSQKTPALDSAIIHLSGPNRYEYRYGVRRPAKQHATPFVDSCDSIVLWMQKVIDT